MVPGRLLRIAVAAGVTALAIAVMAAPSREHGRLVDQEVTAKLEDDARGALFEVRALAPGQVVSRCIRLTYDAATTGRVVVSGDGRAADLNDHLRLAIDVGRGGRAGNCDGFAGERIFSGTVAQFLARHRGARTGLGGWSPRAGTETRTYRFAIELDDVPDAQGGASMLAFGWAAAAADEPGGGKGSDPAPGGGPGQPANPGPAPAAPAPGASPPDDSPGASSPDALADAEEPGAASPGSSSAGDRRDGRDGAGASGGGPGSSGGPGAAGRGRGEAKSGRDDSDKGILGIRMPRLEDVGRIAEAVATRSALPVGLVGVIAVFLLIQGRLDRLDPKLAMAPRHREPDLVFEELVLPPTSNP